VWLCCVLRCMNIRYFQRNWANSLATYLDAHTPATSFTKISCSCLPQSQKPWLRIYRQYSVVYLAKSEVEG
jgi:hypothetical protein